MIYAILLILIVIICDTICIVSCVKNKGKKSPSEYNMMLSLAASATVLTMFIIISVITVFIKNWF